MRLCVEGGEMEKFGRGLHFFFHGGILPLGDLSLCNVPSSCRCQERLGKTSISITQGQVLGLVMNCHGDQPDTT